MARSDWDLDDLLQPHSADAPACEAEQQEREERQQPGQTEDAALTAVYIPDEEDAPPLAADLGQLLVAKGLLSQAQLTEIQQALPQSPGKTLLDAVRSLDVDEAALHAAVAEHEGLPFETLDLSRGPDVLDGQLVQRLTPAFCKEREAAPLRKEQGRVVLGVTRADDVLLVDEVRRRLGASSVKLVIVTPSDLRAALEFYGAAEDEVREDVEDILSDIDEDDVQVQESSDEEVDLEKQAGESPVIRYVNYILQTAVKEGASDIHIEPGEKGLKVRFRIDGVLFEMMNPPARMAAAITSRLKIMANLDISERRLPQDGRIRAMVRGRRLDLRVSTLPTPYGEKTVLRILDTRSINVELEQLGFDEATLEIWRHQIAQPHGIILVTGPTGSGKTTTLYSSLRQMDKQRLNISTVEDPVEYHLDGVTQTQTHERIGMTFATALKALLRQDPDVIMVGEIRDLETAHTAVQAALTGHLVLSTLHTNDAPSSVTRLVNIGVEPFLVGAALNAVLAQRLVRRVCEHCKEQVEPPAELADFLAMNGMASDAVWQGAGCDRCRNTGYSGRLGVYELLVVDDQLRDVVARNPNVSEFRRLCVERGMVSLREDGLRKAAQGLTTIAEVIRVTESH